MPNHKDLISYQKAKLLIKEVIKLSDQLPKTRAFETLYSQLIRSCSSIGANIVEGYGRNNIREYKQFLGISRGSSLETEYWLEILQDFSGINMGTLIELNSEIIKIETATIKNLKV